jgi:hypothetical protein
MLEYSSCADHGIDRYASITRTTTRYLSMFQNHSRSDRTRICRESTDEAGSSSARISIRGHRLSDTVLHLQKLNFPADRRSIDITHHEPWEWHYRQDLQTRHLSLTLMCYICRHRALLPQDAEIDHALYLYDGSIAGHIPEVAR